MYKQITMRLPAQTMEKLEALAGNAGLSRGRVISALMLHDAAILEKLIKAKQTELNKVFPVMSGKGSKLSDTDRALLAMSDEQKQAILKNVT